MPKSLKKRQASRKGPHARFIVNEAGERVEVVLPITAYEKLLQQIEELEDIRDAKAARAEGQWESLAAVKQRLGLA